MTIVADRTDAKNTEDVDFETAIHFARYGTFQKRLLAVCGLIYATCAMSTTTLSFVLPSAECDFNLSSNDKGKLSATPLIGMIFGCCFWGIIADAKGRKTALIFSLLVDFSAGFSSCFATSFSVFLTCRFFNGFGIIGATSIVFPYLGEFLPNSKRDNVLGKLELFWNVGIIILPGFAWVFLNQSTYAFFTRNNYGNPWRFFLFLYCLPSLFSAISVYFLPETPKFLISRKRFENAKIVLRKVYRVNTKQPHSTYPVISLNGESNNNQENVEKKQNSFKKIFEKICRKPFVNFLGIVAVTDFCLMSSYYTLIMWFPEIFQRFNDYEKTYNNVSAGICEISPGIISQEFSEKICEPFISNRVFIETLIIALTCIPSSISLSFFMVKLGKKHVLIISLFSSGLATIALNFVSNSTQTLILSAIFESLTSILEAVLFCVVVELFPTNLRAPALAITATSGRLGAIFGNLIFGMLIDVQCNIPFYLFGFMLIGSGLLCFKIPKSDNYTIIP